jgi:hypothetical protein
MSKQTSYDKIHHSDVRFMWTSARLRVYPVDAFLPTDGFLPSASMLKNASARTGSCVRADASLRPCKHTRVRADATMRSRGHRRVHADELTSLPCPRPPSVLPRSPCADGLMRPCRCAKKINYFILFIYLFIGSCLLEKRGKKCSVFGFQSLRSPRSPGFAGEAARRKRFFRPSSLSLPSKLYSSLGWLNSKVPKPFSPFSLRLIDVDGF